MSEAEQEQQRREMAENEGEEVLEQEVPKKSFLEQFQEEQNKESPGSWVILVVFIVFVTSGVYDLIHEQLYQQNPCSMTYMYEYPAYIDLNVTYSDRGYKLFVYGEGQFADRLQNKIFNGIPVLFLPGTVDFA